MENKNYTNANTHEIPKKKMSKDEKKKPKSNKNPNEKLYIYENTASPKANDPPVPNRAHTEM